MSGIIGIDLRVKRYRFRPKWYAPATWFRHSLYEIEVVGHGYTDALRIQDIAHMAREYVALQEHREPTDYEIRSVEWL